jgi:uncharacterized protein YndB with AHSA1/START domain
VIRAALLVVGALVAIVAIVTVIGYSLPRAHTASREAAFADPPDQVFAVLQDVERYATWRSDVERVEVIARTPAPRWREHGGNDTITFEVQESQAPTRLVTRIADPSLPFGGRWTYALTADGAGTRLTITEHGDVYNPIFRFLSRFVFGHTATIETFLADLERHLTASRRR